MDNECDDKRCRCGAAYDRARWQRLSLVGVQRFEGELPLELRHCEECSNTLARAVEDRADR